MSDQQVIYSMVRVGRIYPPNKQVLRDISLGFYYGAKIGVLGLNGAGKSTLLHIMAGLDPNYVGEIAMSKGYTVGLLEQEPQLDPKKTVKGVVEEAVQPIVALLARYDEINNQFSDPDADFDALIADQARIQETLDKLDAWTLDNRLEMAMDALRCPPGDTSISVLSGGERRRVALCRLLLTEPDILLLDEPTNHLDAESVAWLEKHLQQYKGTVIAVTHDRYFLDNVAGWILELDRGYGIPWKGNYTSWLEQKRERLAVEEKGESKRQKTLERELDWIRMSPKARQAKGKARVTAYDRLLSQEYEQLRENLEIYIPPGPRLGDLVIELKGVSKAYGERLLIDRLDLSVPPGSILGVIGPNGAGKTTLLRLITNIERPDSGSVRIGETVTLAYVDQSRESLNGEKTVWEEISGGLDTLTLGSRTRNSRGYVSSFNFLGSDQQKLVKSLSGGERNRVHLAKVLTQGANVILLDEPTNDLDVNTLRALEEALEDFAGCAIVVSHDRWFLDRIATHILAFEGDSQVHWFDGNYSDYEADRRRRLGIAADTPHRIKYRSSDAITMQIHFLRHATMVIKINGLSILVDPMLSSAGAMDPVANAGDDRRIPLVDLPLDQATLERLLRGLDAVLVTHSHRDHWDGRAVELLPKALPVICQPPDVEKITAAGFKTVLPVETQLGWNDLSFSRTGGQHGVGEIGQRMAPVSGFIIQAPGSPTVYIAGDTIWCPEVDRALEQYWPDITILNTGSAQFLTGGPITMDAQDVAQVCRAQPGTRVVAVHLEALNHCKLSREELRSELEALSLIERVLIPVDGETLTL